MLFSVVTWCAAALVIFCVIFFIICGCILLLDTTHVIVIREGARKQISRVFFGTILVGLAACVAFLLSPQTLEMALKQAEQEKNRATVAEAQTEKVVEQLRAPDAHTDQVQNVVFIHTFKNTRQDEALRISNELKFSGYLAPGIDGLDIRVTDDQVRYFHRESESAAETVAALVGINNIVFTDGYQSRVGIDHLEIWLSP